ncbi:MAG: hypothetical protein LBH43_00540 [Treponema sp.]|jgi:murein DD-endopeptidase MepM/ murein hydrolase activator NlpD|nr:hypothetical protein [Treponema sp.]
MKFFKNVLRIGLFFLTVFQLKAQDWPSPNGVMINNFGWNDGGRPVLGIIFSAEGGIEASGQGEILFQGGTSSGVSALPSPLGAWTALDHGNGIISVYSRMDEKNERPDLPFIIEKNTVLGYAGASGWSAINGFYFFLYDRKERRWLNPSMITNPKPDNRPPVINAVWLRNAEGRVIDPAQIRTLSQGRYFISVSAVDTMLTANEAPLAPFRIICSVNGIETGSLNFETYLARDGSLMVYRNGLVPVREVFFPQPGWEAGEISFTRGQANLEVIVQDYSGNSRRALYRLQIE